MLPSRTAVTPLRPAVPPRRPRPASGSLRPALVYALAAALGIVAAEAVTRQREPAAEPAAPAPRARALQRQDPPAESDDFGHAAPLPVVGLPASSEDAPERGPSAAEPAPRADEPAIPADAWKVPPPLAPDPSARPSIREVWPARGPGSGGAQVELRGRNLDPAFVLFGRTPARILEVRPAETGEDVIVRLVAPPRTGPALEWVVVTNRDGSSAVAAERFGYDP